MSDKTKILDYKGLGEFLEQLKGAYSANDTVEFNTFTVAKADAATTAGSATTADKLKTAQTIQLTGTVTGSANFDGSTGISITTHFESNPQDSEKYSYLNLKDLPEFKSVATSGSYEDLTDKPYGQEITTKYTLGNFSYTMNPEYIDPVTGNWRDPEHLEDTEPVEKAWGYDAENDRYTSDYIKWDSLVKGYPDTWTDYGTEYNATIWGDPMGQQYALANPDLSDFITEPADLLNYSVKLTCNGTEYLLPILQHTGTDQDSGYYAGQLSTGEVAYLVDPTGTYDSDHKQAYAHTLYTHPFQIHFGIDNNEIYELLVSLRIAGDVVLENVEIVEAGPVKMIDPQYIPVMTNTEIDALISNS